MYKSFWIRKSHDVNEKPVGYIFSVMVEHEGKKVPYIVTVNGASLTFVDVDNAINMIAKYHNANEVIVPQFVHGVNWHFVNFDSCRYAMSHNRGRKVSVDMPTGWDVVEK